MSANAEIVRRAYAAAGGSEPDVDTLVELYAPDHVLTTEWGIGERKRYRGLDGYLEARAETGELLGDFRNELEDVVDAGDEVVVAVVRASGRGQASGTPVEMRLGAVVRLRDGKIVDTEYFVDVDQALAAAGLKSP